MEAGRMRIHAGLGDIPELVASIEAGDSAPILSLLERWMKRDRR
jgi:hypothetical protein